jgi:hypothetical protein
MLISHAYRIDMHKAKAAKFTASGSNASLAFSFQGVFFKIANRFK